MHVVIHTIFSSQKRWRGGTRNRIAQSPKTDALQLQHTFSIRLRPRKVDEVFGRDWYDFGCVLDCVNDTRNSRGCNCLKFVCGVCMKPGGKKPRIWKKAWETKADSEFLCFFMLNECVGKRLASQDVCQEDERMGSKGDRGRPLWTPLPRHAHGRERDSCCIVFLASLRENNCPQSFLNF